MIRVLLCAVCTLVHAPILAAQDSGLVWTGHIRGPNGPIDRAKITVAGNAARDPAVLTDSDGVCQVELLPSIRAEKLILIRIEAPGYQRRQVQEQALSRKPLEIVLAPLKVTRPAPDKSKPSPSPAATPAAVPDV